VNVGALGLVGMSCADAQDVLAQNRLESKTKPGSPAASKNEADRVQAVSNDGNATPGETITLTCSTEPTELTKQPAGASVTGTGDGGAPVAGGPVRVQLPTYTCPSGTGNLDSYTVTATNGRFINGSDSGNSSTITTGPNPGDLQLTVTGAEGQQLQISYTATCRSNNGTLTSPASKTQSFDIAAPPEQEPSTSPTEGGAEPAPTATTEP
jgi:serine/threonine-protein kinase